MQKNLNRGVRNILCESVWNTQKTNKVPRYIYRRRRTERLVTNINSVECRIQHNYQLSESLNLERFDNALQNAPNRFHPFNGVCRAVSLEIPSIVQVRQKRQRLVCSCNFISSPPLATGDNSSKIRTQQCRKTGHLWRIESLNSF